MKRIRTFALICMVVLPLLLGALTFHLILSSAPATEVASVQVVFAQTLPASATITSAPPTSETFEPTLAPPYATMTSAVATINAAYPTETKQTIVAPTPLSTASTTQTPRPSSTSVPATYYTTTIAEARFCPQIACEVRSYIPSGVSVLGVQTVPGDIINGSNVWHRVLYTNREMYIPSSALSSTPTLRPPTETPDIFVLLGRYILYAGNGRGPTRCRDGTISRSAGSGTCSHHGGIAR